MKKRPKLMTVPKTPCCYNPTTVLGEGEYGIVYRVTPRMVMKCGKYANGDNKTQPTLSLRKEWDALRELEKKQSPYIIHLFEHYVHESHGFSLILEYCPKTLNDLVYHRRKSLFSRREVHGIMNQISQALEVAHSIHWLHRDLKPDNILIAMDGTLKLADWGLAGYVEPGDTRKLTVPVFAEAYRAPELFLGENPYTDKVDIWAEGCILSELLLGHIVFTNEKHVPLPYPKNHEYQVFHKILAMLGNVGEDFPEEWGKLRNAHWLQYWGHNYPRLFEFVYRRSLQEFKDILLEIWQYQPSKRPSATQLRALFKPFPLPNISVLFA